MNRKSHIKWQKQKDEKVSKKFYLHILPPMVSQHYLISPRTCFIESQSTIFQMGIWRHKYGLEQEQ